MNACHQPCPCWEDLYPYPERPAGDHHGHCCLLIDGHTNPPADTDWRTDTNACEPPHAPDDALDTQKSNPADPADPLAYDTPDITEPPC